MVATSPSPATDDRLNGRRSDRAGFAEAEAEHRGNSPLDGALVLEIGSLLPGPLAALMLAEAGAEVIKIERPPHGDPMRGYEPQINGTSVQYHALNRGKKSIFIDLADEASTKPLEPLLRRADILIEQFRPGVMERHGLDYARVRSINPRIIYCSISGWGQNGPKAHLAAHDLNFMAESGHLDKIVDGDGKPALPALLAADVAGGVYPAVINILLAYIRRNITGEGCYLDMAIFDGMMPFHYDTLIPALKTGISPERGQDLVTGRSPRYQLYRTADGRHLAVAAVEEKFWRNFCAMIGLDARFVAENISDEVLKVEVAKCVEKYSAAELKDKMQGQDVCCSIVARLDEVLIDPQVKARGLLDRQVGLSEHALPALPLPVAPQFRSSAALSPAPLLEQYSFDPALMGRYDREHQDMIAINSAP
jgi:alpha-methylacyl-CoA racemase